jgi:hypothetical protein
VPRGGLRLCQPPEIQSQASHLDCASTREGVRTGASDSVSGIVHPTGHGSY